MFFKNLLKKIKSRGTGLPFAGRISGGGFLPQAIKNRSMMANRMGGFLRNRPRLMERLANASNIRNMGRGMMNPNMQFGIMGIDPAMRRSMKAKMMGLPDPKDFDVNDLPFPQPGQRSDIMPRDPGFGVNMPKRPPMMPGVMPRGMAGGGGVNKEEPKEYPNEGLAALAASGEKGKEAVEAMGYRGGGGVVLEEQKMVDNDADMMNYQRALQNYQQFYFAQPDAFRKNLPHPDQMYNDQGNQGEQGIVALLT